MGAMVIRVRYWLRTVNFDEGCVPDIAAVQVAPHRRGGIFVNMS